VWECAWRQGRLQATYSDVFVIDEAGMVGTRQMERVLRHAAQARAKVVLVGDTQQLQAIEAGAPMRLLAERYGSVQMADIKRQRDAQQQRASLWLATGKTAAALQVYTQQRCVEAHATRQAAMAEMVRC
jgi:ATP-dependent exoDNAse (exonuclease V) alpha subunit